MSCNTSAVVQVTDCYSEPHIFVEVSDLQPWMIISFNQGALKTIGALHITDEYRCLTALSALC